MSKINVTKDKNKSIDTHHFFSTVPECTPLCIRMEQVVKILFCPIPYEVVVIFLVTQNQIGPISPDIFFCGF